MKTGQRVMFFENGKYRHGILLNGLTGKNHHKIIVDKTDGTEKDALVIFEGDATPDENLFYYVHWRDVREEKVGR